MKLSIIVPVYNVELYICPCLESIFRQGLDDSDFELILVNDGTPDNSFGVIQDIINSHSNVHVVEQENQGLSVARNTGLRIATGEYVIFVDSDDLLVDNSLPKLLDTVKNQTVDMVIAGFVKMSNDEIDSFDGINSQDTSFKLQSATQLFLHDFNPRQCYVWRTVYKNSFLKDNNLCFMPGIFFEDVPFTTECYLKAKKCIKSSVVFYIYRQRENSIVSTVNLTKILDFNSVLARLWQLMHTFPLSDNQKRKLMDTIFVTFSVSFWFVSHDRLLMSKRFEIINDLRHKVPNLCFTNGVKQKAVSFVYRLSPNLYLSLRSIFTSLVSIKFR